MTQSNLAIAEDYYSALQSGDYDKIGSYLHNDVKYADPNWPLRGKDQVWPIAKSFGAAVNQLKTAAKFSSNDQVMLVHDVLFQKDGKPLPNPLRTAVLMTFDNGLIKEIELISDVSKHMVSGDDIGDVCKEIFSYQP